MDTAVPWSLRCIPDSPGHVGHDVAISIQQDQELVARESRVVSLLRRPLRADARDVAATYIFAQQNWATAYYGRFEYCHLGLLIAQ